MALELNRHIKGEHRSWWVRTIPGTTDYTVHAWPTPAYGGNPAAAIEDGVLPSIRAAYAAMLDAEDADNGMDEA